MPHTKMSWSSRPGRSRRLTTCGDGRDTRGSSRRRTLAELTSQPRIWRRQPRRPRRGTARAYLLLRDGTRAVQEFQKFVDHPGLVVNSPLGALARLGLARAYALQSDAAKARAAYQDFLTLWKDADPDLPVLKQAQSEYARLN